MAEVTVDGASLYQRFLVSTAVAYTGCLQKNGAVSKNY
jgi:hypothetical protein